MSTSFVWTRIIGWNAVVGLTCALIYLLRIKPRFIAITAAAKASQEQVVQLKKLNSLLIEGQQLSQTGSWEYDIATEKTVWSDETCRIYGLETGEVPLNYERFLALAPPASRERIRGIIQKALQEKRPFSYQHDIVRPDGTLRKVQGMGRIR